MTTSEHLQRIKSKCEQLLETASKRTPGKWAKNTCKPHVAGESSTHSVDGPPSDFMYIQEESDASFIASCAGPAEAGWKTTIAAIDDLEEIHESTPLGEYAAWDALNKILSAWPEELL